MQICPVCGKEYQAAACPACGFDRSCDFESHPTLAILPAGLDSISRRKTILVSSRRNAIFCPRCGRLVAPVQDHSQPPCRACDTSARLADAALKKSLDFQTAYHELTGTPPFSFLGKEERLISLFEYLSLEQAEILTGLFKRAAAEYIDDSDYSTGTINLIFHEVADDAAYLLSQKEALGPRYDYAADTHRFLSRTMQELVTARKRASAFTFPPFDIDQYLLYSRDDLFVRANNAYYRQDFRKALDLYLECDRQGNPYAAARIGMIHYHGLDTPTDHETAFLYFSRGAAKGCPLAAAWIADCYYTGHGAIRDFDCSRMLYINADAGLRNMCDAGDPAAMYCMGVYLHRSPFFDSQEGIPYLTRALEKGEKLAAIELSQHYLFGYGVDKNVNTAFALLRDNPIPAYHESHFRLGQCHYYGEGTPKDLQTAKSRFQQAASMGNGTAKSWLGTLNKNIQNYAEAAKWYKDAADNHNDPHAAWHLADLYMEGKGVERNKQTALRYYRTAADAGIIAVQYIVARMYLSGGYTQEEYDTARRWLKSAARLNFEEALYLLGRYYQGDYGFKNQQEAFVSFEKAAERRYPEAEYAMGCCYRDGMYVRRDYAKANEWFRRAAEHDEPQAMYELGISYLEGRGIAEDIPRGIHYLTIAADKGSSAAVGELAVLYLCGIPQKLQPDHALSRRYITQAAQDKTDGSGQFRIATMLHFDAGKPETAIKWYVRAVANNHAEAKLELAKLYIQKKSNLKIAFHMLREITPESIGKPQYAQALYWLSVCLKKGYGCEKDRNQAAEYYEKAISNGYKDTAGLKRLFDFF